MTLLRLLIETLLNPARLLARNRVKDNPAQMRIAGYPAFQFEDRILRRRILDAGDIRVEDPVRPGSLIREIDPHRKKY